MRDAILAIVALALYVTHQAVVESRVRRVIEAVDRLTEAVRGATPPPPH